MDNEDLLKSLKRSLRITFTDNDEELQEIILDAVETVKSEITGEEELFNEWLHEQRSFRIAVLAHAKWDNLKINQTESPQALTNAVRQRILRLRLGVNRLRREIQRGDNDGSQ